MGRTGQVEFAISPPSFRRGVALGAALFFSLPIMWFAWKAGAGFIKAPLSLLLCGMCLLPTVLFLRLAFPPRSAMAKLQVRHDGISFLPGRLVRRYFAQAVIDVTITPDAEEILLRQRGLPNGYSVVVRSADGHEREVYAQSSLTMHSAEEIRIISEGIARATGLAVRAVRRSRLPDGTLQECPWTELAGAKTRLTFTLAYAALPLVAGAVLGYFSPAISTAVTVGVALAIFQILLRLTTKQSAAQKAIRIATALVISGSAYAFAYVLTAYEMGNL